MKDTLAYTSLISALFAGLIAVTPQTHAAAPVAADDSRTVPVDRELTIDVLRNDYDPDGTSLTVTGTTDPQHGSVSVNPDGSIRYSPDGGYTGSDSFTYTVQDEDTEVSAPATVTINVADTVLSPLTAGPNDRSVAAVLDDMCQRLTTAPEEQIQGGTRVTRERCEALLDLSASSPDSIDGIVNRIAPEETVALMQTSQDSSASQRGAVAQRSAQLIRGINRFSINGIAMADTASGGTAGDETSPWSQLGIFATVLHEGAEKDRTELESGFDYSANGLVVGLDYRFTSDLIAGAAVGWSDNELEYSDNGGQVDTTTLSLISYLSWQQGNLSVTGQLGYGSSDFDTQRHIRYQEPGSLLDVTATGSTGGEQLFLSLGSEYLWSRDQLTLSPYVQMDYVQSSIDGYTENKAQGWEVELGEQSLDLLTLRLGTQAQYSLSYQWGVLIPSLDLALLSEAAASQDKVTGRFAYDIVSNATFEIEADKKDTFYMQAGAGVVSVFKNGVSAFLETRMTAAYSNISAYQVLAGIRYEL